MRDVNRSSVRQFVSSAGLLRFFLVLVLMGLLVLVGCTAHADPAAEAPPPANIVPGVDPALFTVDHPEQFPLAAALERPATSELVVTGTVTPDITRNVPVVSLASGRVVAIHARLGDTVKKGQLLLTVRSDDVAGGFDAYRKAVADELLARKQLNRATDLYAHGAIAEQDLEVAQDAANNAKVTLETATEHLRLLGNDPDKPMSIVDIVAPTAGVITDQQVTNAATGLSTRSESWS
jgi:cobalt-zinc-cadmium efflux system membrane fusion protein